MKSLQRYEFIALQLLTSIQSDLSARDILILQYALDPRRVLARPPALFYLLEHNSKGHVLFKYNTSAL